MAMRWIAASSCRLPPRHSRWLSKQLGCGQRPAAGQAEQVGRQLGDPLAQLSGEPVDARRQSGDRGRQLLADGDLHRPRGAGQPGGDLVQGWAKQASGGVLQLGVELVQVPAQPG
jgi:hypothetical protein